MKVFRCPWSWTNLKFYVLFCLFGLVVFLPAASAWALEVQNLRFGEHSDKSRIVLELSDNTDYRVFALSDPYRVVIDLPHFSWGSGAVKPPPGVGVSALRHGHLQPGVSRIVMDMKYPPYLQKVFILPEQGSKAARLVIDLGETSAGMFQTYKTKVFGELDEHKAAQNHKAQVAADIAKPAVKPQSFDRSTAKPVQKKSLVVIDPGHGGVDPGATGAGRKYEKHVVLALARELRDELLSSGRYRVIMTRDTDKFIKLRDRVQFARDRGADLFISIHADSIGKSNVRGASVYTLSNKASDAQTAKLAARENKADLIAGIDLSHEDKDVADILVDLAMRDTMNQSRFFANTLVNHFKSHGVRMLQNPHRYAGFAVLKAPDIPSVLLEAGFMSNKKEVEMLQTRAYRAKIAGALVRGIDDYFDRVARQQE